MFNHKSMPNPKSSKNLTGCPKTRTQSNLPLDWYQAIIASTIEGFFIANLQGEFLDVNDAFCRMLGYSRYELLTMKLQDIEALEKPEEIRQHGFMVKSSGSDLFNTCLRSKDGQIIEVQISAKYLGDDTNLFFVFAQGITQQKRLYQKLKESEERYRALIELGGRVGEAVVMLQDNNKGEGIQTFVSNEWCHITGYSEKELLGMPFFYLLNPKYRKASLERHRKKVDGESIPGYFEMSIIRKDGVEVPIEATSAYSIYQGEKVNVAYIREITERKQAEDRYKTIIQSTLDGFFLSDLQGNILDVNDAFCHMLGYSREELLLMTVCDFDLEYMDSPEKLRQRIQKVKGEGSYSGEVRHRCKDGRIIDVAVSIKYLDIKPGFFFCFHRDITEHKQIDDKLRESKEFSENLISSMKDGFSILDNQGVHVNVNDALCQMTGFTREELIGVGLPHPYWPEEEYQDIQASFQKTLRGEFEDFELIFKKKNGERFPVIVSPSWLRDKEGNVISYFATVKDISERKRIEEELKQYQAHLEELVEKRTAELGEQLSRRVKFTRALVHELKTPLTPLVAASDFLVSGLSEEPLLSFAKNINKGALNLSRKIDELLDLARGEVGILELRYGRVEFLQLLEDTVDYTKAEASENKQSLILDTPFCLPIVWADEERLRQILLNLLDNAFKFTPKGGEITLKVREKDAGLAVEVKDNGCGIDEEAMKHLFEPYKRQEGSKASLSGLGLGLPLSKMLIELHSGKIWAESQEGKGSTFSFWLPLNTLGQKEKELKKI